VAEHGVSNGAGGSRTSLVRRPSRRSRFEGAVRLILFGAAIVSVLTTAAIVVSLIRETVRFFGDVPFADFMFGTKWTPLLAGDQQSFGVLPLIWGTFYLTGIGLLVAIPIGLLCAIYLAEFAPRRVRKVVKPVLEILAGVPTIVFGYFARARRGWARTACRPPCASSSRQRSRASWPRSCSAPRARWGRR
jgi:phosphate transport system permease protein